MHQVTFLWKILITTLMVAPCNFRAILKFKNEHSRNREFVRHHFYTILTSPGIREGVDLYRILKVYIVIIVFTTRNETGEPSFKFIE